MIYHRPHDEHCTCSTCRDIDSANRRIAALEAENARLRLSIEHQTGKHLSLDDGVPGCPGCEEPAP